MADLVRYTGGNEWSALYVDGRLDTVGDHYLVDERIAQIAGVEIVDSEDFMLGGSHYEHVARTLDDIQVFSERREALEAQAEALRAQAAELETQARRLTNQANGLSR